MPDTPFDSRPDTYVHIGVVRRLLGLVVKALLDRADGHDASKLADPEREMFDEFTPRLKGSTYGSEEYRGFLADMGVALRHHYEHNAHHPEHHADGIAGMTLIDLTEMVCDWIAATRRHDDGDIFRSIEVNQGRFGYGDELKAVLRNTAEAVLAAEAALAEAPRSLLGVAADRQAEEAPPVEIVSNPDLLDTTR